MKEYRLKKQDLNYCLECDKKLPKQYILEQELKEFHCPSCSQQYFLKEKEKEKKEVLENIILEKKDEVCKRKFSKLKELKMKNYFFRHNVKKNVCSAKKKIRDYCSKSKDFMSEKYLKAKKFAKKVPRAMNKLLPLLYSASSAALLHYSLKYSFDECLLPSMLSSVQALSSLSILCVESKEMENSRDFNLMWIISSMLSLSMNIASIAVSEGI